MALSAFKSTSKRGKSSAPCSPISSAKNSHPEDSAMKIIPPRRARSVSAAPRSHSNPSSSSDILEYVNMRDNPLFSCSSSSSPESKGPDGISSGSRNVSNRRSRSVSGNSGFSNQSSSSSNHSGRSLSRVGTSRRGRSVSRSHYSSYEIEGDQCSMASSSKSKESGRGKLNCQKIDTEVDNFGVAEQRTNLQAWSSRPPLWETSSSCGRPQHWEDGISTSSFSEAEEITISTGDFPQSNAAISGRYATIRSEVRRAVSEIRNDLENVIRVKNPSIITTEEIVDIPPEVVNHKAIELVCEMRQEYATKLEKSQERARKLLADLAVEEQRGEELHRILKEILPGPETSDTRISQPRRRRSIERVKMSRRLAEEALNYFDECVSISTFDSFSSQEEPQPGLVPDVHLTGSSKYFPSEGSNLSVWDCPTTQINNHEEMDEQTHWLNSSVGSDLVASSICSGSKPASPMESIGNHNDLADFGSSETHAFSFARVPLETDGVHDIRSYIMKFEKGSTKEGVEYVEGRLRYSTEDYDVYKSDESFLFDQMNLRSRIHFGGLLLCDIRTF